MSAISRESILEGSFQANLLQDARRLNAYARAIAKIVRPGDVVADIGAGSGIMSHLALKAGAGKVFAVEVLPKTFHFLRRTLRENHVGEQVVAVHADGQFWKPPEPVDVVVCELMETGLLHEPMAAVVRNIHTWDQKPRSIIPGRTVLAIRLVEAWTRYQGYHVRNAGFQPKCRRLLSAATPYLELDFGRDTPANHVRADVELTATSRGTVTALRLETTAYAAGVRVPPSARHCTPLVLTLDQPFDVEKGDRVRVQLSYSFAFDADPIQFHVTRINGTSF